MAKSVDWALVFADRLDLRNQMLKAMGQGVDPVDQSTKISIRQITNEAGNNQYFGAQPEHRF